MRVRRATPADVDALVDFPHDPGVIGLPDGQVRADFETGRMRPEWSWVLEEEGRLLGRALWWGRGDTVPSVLDALDVLPEVHDPRAAAVELLRGGHADLAASGKQQLPPYTLRLPAGWRADARATRAATWPREATSDVGLTASLERRQYAWTPANGVPGISTRAAFRRGSNDEFVELFREAARGSLDVGTRQALESTDELSQAKEDLEFYESCPGERDWWRVATDRDGVPVGFIVPSATPYHRNVGYLAVLPSHRGQGLVDDLLGEVTRIHAEAGAERITATTDMTNLPMAAAFDRASYQVTEVRLVLEAAPSRAT
ncbi:GNAT family N-acetyltransferase [Nocardioides cavernae]|uniref:GNAT family N-acetyltransferase n=1 Tax=Nocardioides cavernae TaxID=1921566 RepID=A0ABR8N7F1_9ACTN|nr:GNAT family N-acetyltransferase [Nocardioides cavernae]MBD3923785.1 GNAT family N-acetyltransferase [Nocardioides cavernae]MBM7511282.1 RimJ/RimL family protein N-acetyltransferase [Nocardioides cavernae]